MSTEPTIVSGESPDTSTFHPTDAVDLNKWIVDTIEPYIKPPTLEMDSGLGSMSAVLVEKGIRIRLSDKSKSNRDKLRERFNGIEAVRQVYSVDFCRPDFESYYSKSFGTFGTVIALNVGEYGFYDNLAIQNARHFLRERGHLIFMAPAYTSMFNGLEEDPESCKRYNRTALKHLLKGNFEILKARYLNLDPVVDNVAPRALGLSVLAIVRKI